MARPELVTLLKTGWADTRLVGPARQINTNCSRECPYLAGIAKNPAEPAAFPRPRLFAAPDAENRRPVSSRLIKSLLERALQNAQEALRI
jgi:hypothetical protein